MVKEDNTVNSKYGQNADGSYDCNSVIRKCIYSSKMTGTYFCDFLCKTGHSRGCSPRHCSEFATKGRRKSNNFNQFQGSQV